MECTSLLSSAINDGDVSTKLFKGTSHKNLVTDLQRTLFELGFEKQLKWDQYQADGQYGNATQAALVAFAKKNGLDTDGSKVTNELAKILVRRHDFLPSMYLLWEIHNSDLRTRKFISKGTKMSIIAIQTLLNTLGYREAPSGDLLEEDGLYGPETTKAFIAFAKDNNIDSDGDWLSRPLINLLLKEIDLFYGKDWSTLAANNLPNASSPLILYQGTRFVGNPCRADVQFKPMLEKINTYAEQAQVFIYVTSSFRTTTNVAGAIVTPATRSNHLAGHGIDMNIKYGNGGFANSKVLTKYPDVPAPVRQFLTSIIDDPALRWGGNFSEKDPVHIDDGLNQNGPAWDKRYELMQKAVQLGK
ncbi:MAG: peptidoglycan-binding protein [Saprospiraceae bacterium]|nr:peptidoglycan-binding protein [Saprospiraceae bacterium]